MNSPLFTALALGLLALVPSVLLVGTSFVKLSVVLGTLRNALGTPDIPGTLVVLGLSLILSLHVMAPTAQAVWSSARGPITEALAVDPLTPAGLDRLDRAWTAARPPVVRFLRANSSARDRALFLDLARASIARQGATPGVRIAAPAADDVHVLLPAFVVSELTRAFVIAFLVLLPFLVVDLVVANVLAALGLSMVPLGTVSLPFKLLLFVLADGWHLLARGLLLGYR